MIACMHKSRGVALIEVAIGVSIIALVLIFTMYAVTQYIHTGRTVSEKTAALYLAEEGLEMIRFVRDTSWNTIANLNVNATHYFATAGGVITVGNVPENIGEYSRSISIDPLYRDNTTDDIVSRAAPGSVLDVDSKYVTVTVTWGSPAQSISLTTVLTDLDP